MFITRGSSILCLVLLVFAVRADITEYVKDLPPCGLKCILYSISESVCSATNSTCICEDPSLAATTSVCLKQNCTVIESLPEVANISKRSCGVPVESRQHFLMGTAGFGLLAFLCGCFRLFARWDLERTLKTDDWMMVVVLLVEVPFCIMGVMVAYYGVGRNIWDIGTENLTKALKVYYVDEIFYITILGLTKISILMFYLRIFPSQNFQWIAYSVLIWIAVSTVVIDFLTIFQCLPIRHNWLGWMNTMPDAKCQNLNTMTYVTSAMNIAQDFAVLLMPLPWLFRLKVGWRRKVNVILMFSIGAFICMTSCIRLTKIVKFRQTQNPTWDYVETTFWTALEVYTSVMVPNLPAIRSWLSHKLPQIFSMETTRGTQHLYEQSSHPPTFSHGSSRTKPHTATSSSTDVEFADFFSSGSLQLGDKLKGNVYTGITSGPRTSDIELADCADIVVNTETRVEERGGSVHSWPSREVASAGEVKIRDAV